MDTRTEAGENVSVHFTGLLAHWFENVIQDNILLDVYKRQDVLPVHALPQLLDAATGGKAVRDGTVQQVFILFKKSVHADLIHAEEDVVLDHILKPRCV